MSGARLLLIFGLITLFVAGVFGANKYNLFQPEKGELSAQNPSTVRGVVSTLLPSGKVIVVKKEEGDEVFVSLTDASVITNELGEDLFYTDVKAGMPISAAGIRGVKDNVLLPSLVTVSLAYTAKGVMSLAEPSLQHHYFTFHYNDVRWKIGSSPSRLEYQSVPGCVFEAAAARPVVAADWVVSTTERRINGNIFQDVRYATKDGEQKFRVITLEDPGEKYGLRGEPMLGGIYDFVVSYSAPISGEALLNCTRAVDELLATFQLRGSSKNILLVEPTPPVRVTAGQQFFVRGMAHTFDKTIRATIVNEAGDRVVAETIPVEPNGVSGFGAFRQFLVIPKTAESRLQLRIFQYSPRDGSPMGMVSLPMSVN